MGSSRRIHEMYPDFTAELVEIEKNGVSAGLVQRILRKHRPNAVFNRRLHERYCGVTLPIFEREPRFEQDADEINNKINSDFFGEIVDFKTGYFAGEPVAYAYSKTAENRKKAGGEAELEQAGRVLSRFVVRNNLFDLDMETTRYAAICGYAARLFYIDKDGEERVMLVPPYEAAILSGTDMTQPEAGVRAFWVVGLDDQKKLFAEVYTSREILFYEGTGIEDLVFVKRQKHLFDSCPLQGVPNNREVQGDVEKVLEAIDAYDRALSDANNESESFANAYMVFDNVNIAEDEIAKGQQSGAFQYFQAGGNKGEIYFVTKDINDQFIEHHLDRLEGNIYRFSKTPNMDDMHFTQNSSGIALKFKLMGLETKCGMFQAKMMSAGNYMFRLLASVWAKKQIVLDPMDCVMEFHRNFPLDLISEAEAVKEMLEAGLPERIAYSQLSFVDDLEWVMELKEEERLEKGTAEKVDKEIPDGEN